MEEIQLSRSVASDMPHRHDYFTIIWCIEGKGKHMIDFEWYELAGNQLYIILPGQVHHLMSSENPKGWVVSFTKSFMDFNGIAPGDINRLFLNRSCTNHAALSVNEELGRALELYLGEMYRIQLSTSANKYELIGTLLKLVLLSCQTHCVPVMPECDNVSGGQVAIMQAFRESVTEHIKSLHKVGEYAELIGVSSGYLNEVVKSATGTAAKDYLTAQLLTESKRLLAFTELNQKKIAYNLGFKEPAHLSHFSKKHTGVSANDFRKSFSSRA